MLPEGVELTIDDFQRVSDRVPLLADMKPSGVHVQAELTTGAAETLHDDVVRPLFEAVAREAGVAVLQAVHLVTATEEEDVQVGQQGAELAPVLRQTGQSFPARVGIVGIKNGIRK